MMEALEPARALQPRLEKSLQSNEGPARPKINNEQTNKILQTHTSNPALGDSTSV